jgi:hypothetical protein
MPKRSDKIIQARNDLNTPNFAGKKKKQLVVNTAASPTVVTSDGQTIAGHQRAYVAVNDPVVQGAIRIGLLRVLSE